MKPILTVTTAATDLTLLTEEQLRAAVGLAIDDSSKDAELALLGATVAAMIADACNLPVDGATPATLRSEVLSDSFYLDDSWADQLILSRKPVTAIASITEDEIALETTDWRLDKATGLLRRMYCGRPASWTACGEIVVAYTAGWATVPATLAQAASKLALDLWGAKGRDPSLKRERNEGMGEREYWVGASDDPAITEEVMEMLRRGGYANAAVG